MLSPRAMILRAPGTNCDHETAHAFERAGAIARRVHVHALAQKPSLADDFQILSIPGGFSYGDDIASGRIFALELRSRLTESLAKFRDRGGLILGIMENYGQAVFGTQWRDVVAFVLLVLVLLVRPTGILGESLGKARA